MKTIWLLTNLWQGLLWRGMGSISGTSSFIAGGNCFVECCVANKSYVVRGFALAGNILTRQKVRLNTGGIFNFLRAR